jgi:hypothetical protein
LPPGPCDDDIALGQSGIEHVLFVEHHLGEGIEDFSAFFKRVGRYNCIAASFAGISATLCSGLRS